MTQALTALGWCLVLALVQIGLAAGFRTLETGPAYNVGPRDEKGPAPGEVTGRLKRAQANLFETLPLFGLAVLIAWAARRESHVVDIAAWTYLGARVIYLPLYALGVPVARSIVWIVGTGAVCVILFEILKPIVLLPA